MLKFRNNFVVHNGGCIEYASLPLENQGLVLVRGENLDEGGSNGSGKTTLFDLLSTTVTGSSGKGARKNDYLPLTGGGNLGLELDFEYGGHFYTVRQYRKHKEHGTAIHITEDGVDITPTTKIDDVQKLVLAKTGLTEREWYGSVYLTQQHSHALVTGTPKEKKAYLSSHFGLDQIDACVRINEKWINAIQLPDEQALRELLATCVEQLATIKPHDALQAMHAELSVKAQALSKQLVDTELEIRTHESARQAEALRQQHVEALRQYDLVLADASRDRVDALRSRLDTAKQAHKTLSHKSMLLDKIAAFGPQDTPDVLQGKIAQVRDSLNQIQDTLRKVSQRDTLKQKLVGVNPPDMTLDDINMMMAKAAKRLADAQAEANLLSTEIQKISSLGDKCPTCLRSVDQEKKDAWLTDRKTRVDALRQKIADLQSSTSELNADLRSAQLYDTIMPQLAGLPGDDVDAADLRSRMGTLETEVQALTASLRAATEYATLVAQLQSCPVVVEGESDVSRIAVLQSQLDVVSSAYEFALKYGSVRFSEPALMLAQTLRNDLSAQHQQVSTDVAQVAADITSRKRLEVQQQDIESKLKKHSAEKQRKRVLEVLQVVLKDVKAKALRDCTEMLRSALPIYVKQLFPQGDVSVDLADEEDSLDFFLRKGNAQIPMSLVSGGQAKRVGLALLFAFAKLGAKETNILIADEPYKDLDVVGRECAFELLTDLGIPSIFITSHDQDQLREKRYDKVYVMRMQGGKSRLYEG